MNSNADKKYKDLGERLRTARTTFTNFSVKEMAKELGLKENTYGGYERGRAEIPKDDLERFCKITGSDIGNILFGNVYTITNADQKIALNSIFIIGEVQAGIWKEAQQWERDDWELEHFDLSDRERSAYGLKVKGDSMDMYYPQGATLVVVPLHDYPLAIESGDHVIVERCKSGDVYEITVKELEIDQQGKAHLIPRSNNPKHQEPIDLFWPYKKIQHHGVDTVEIKGVVIGSINRRKKL